jgi:hypothetical protein
MAETHRCPAMSTGLWFVAHGAVMARLPSGSSSTQSRTLGSCGRAPATQLGLRERRSVRRRLVPWVAAVSGGLRDEPAAPQGSTGGGGYVFNHATPTGRRSRASRSFPALHTRSGATHARQAGVQLGSPSERFGPSTPRCRPASSEPYAHNFVCRMVRELERDITTVLRRSARRTVPQKRARRPSLPSAVAPRGLATKSSAPVAARVLQPGPARARARVVSTDDRHVANPAADNHA